MITGILDHIVSSTQAKPVGPDRWTGHCPAHGSKQHRDLSIKLAGTRLLLHCFAGCLKPAICASLGLELRDLFTDVLDPDPARRREAAQRRDRERQQQEAAARKQGRRIDALRAADFHIRSRHGLDISGWNNQKLDDEMNLLADAYALLASEECDG
jgi:hypothetical protein